MKLEKKWHEASWSVGMLSSGEMLSPVGDLTNSLAMGDSDSIDDGELAMLLLSEDDEATDPFLLAFCALLSVALVSLRNTRSNSSL